MVGMALRCPNCAGDMRKMEKYGVRIDYCPVCRGVWLDRGEIDRLVASVQASPAAEEIRQEMREKTDSAPAGHDLKRVLAELRKEGRIT